MRCRQVVLGLLVVLTGCFTGERPTLTADPFPVGAATGDPSIDAVLAQLDAVDEGPYTAAYTVLTKFGNTTRDARVSVGTGRRSVTVGTVRFITVEAASQTCQLGASDPCSTTIDPARISDTQITPDFYRADAAKRLRRIATAAIGPAVPHVDTLAGQLATCVDVPLSAGTSVYCVLAGGPLARLDDGAVAINMTEFTTAVDETLFVPGG